MDREKLPFVNHIKCCPIQGSSPLQSLTFNSLHNPRVLHSDCDFNLLFYVPLLQEVYCQLGEMCSEPSGIIFDPWDVRPFMNLFFKTFSSSNSLFQANFSHHNELEYLITLNFQYVCSSFFDGLKFTISPDKLELSSI